jgi:hypothetical protein
LKALDARTDARGEQEQFIEPEIVHNVSDHCKQSERANWKSTHGKWVLSAARCFACSLRRNSCGTYRQATPVSARLE